MPVQLRLTFESYAAPALVLNTVVPPPLPAAIEVFTTSFDIEQTLNVGSQSTGAGAGKITFNPFSITKRPDAHSAEFWQRSCSGTPYRKVTLTVSRPGATTPFVIFTMGLVAVKTLAVAADENGDIIETVTFEYGQASYGVAPQNSDGSLGTVVAAGWNRVQNVSIDPAKVGTV
jgi:type VI protein secretion system component Hcp